MIHVPIHCDKKSQLIGNSKIAITQINCTIATAKWNKTYVPVILNYEIWRWTQTVVSTVFLYTDFII
jgi:hypothetical protein